MKCGYITDKPGRVIDNPLYDGHCSVGSYIEITDDEGIYNGILKNYVLQSSQTNL